MLRYLPRGLLLLLACISLQATPAVAEPRIVTLAPNLAELVYAAGAGASLVGTVEYSDYPAAVLEVPRIGDAFRVDYEALRRLEPDVVLAWESGTPRVIVERLQELGFPVTVLDVRQLDTLPLAIERIGQLAGTDVAANAAAQQLREDIATLRQRYAETDPLRVFYQISAAPWFTVSAEHVIDEVLTLCGGQNVFAEVPGIAPAVTLEAILREDPAVIIAGTKDEDWARDWEAWPFVSAVKSGAMYRIDPDYVSRSTPRLLEGAVRICAALEQARIVHAEAVSGSG